jgi:hypothetical protein
MEVQQARIKRKGPFTSQVTFFYSITATARMAAAPMRPVVTTADGAAAPGTPLPEFELELEPPLAVTPVGIGPVAVA